MDKAPPTTVVTVPDDLKLKAWNYCTSQKSMVSEQSDDGLTLVYVFAGDDNLDKITIDDVRKMQNNKNFKSFDEFIAHIFSIHTMVFENVADWYKGKCSCPAYSKHNICKHILCVAYRTLVLPPPDHLIKQLETPAPKKNPRGRPKKATKALLTD